jgi:hypothetical protein
MLGEDDGPGTAATLDHTAEKCRNGHAALRIDRVQSAALKQML